MSSLRNAVSRRAHKERAQPWVNWIPLIEPFVYMIILHLLAMADLCFLFVFSQAFKEEIWASWKAQGLCRACTSIPQKGADFAGKVTDFVLLFSWCLADSQNQKKLYLYIHIHIYLLMGYYSHLYFLCRNLRRKQLSETQMNFTSGWSKQEMLMESIN